MRWFARILAHLVLYLTDPRTDPMEVTQSKDLEILVLRQQLALARQALRKRKRRLRPNLWFRGVWILLSRAWPRWRSACVLIQPETVIRWHRLGFRLFWRWRSRSHGEPGRPVLSLETRTLIRKMAQEIVRTLG